MLEVGAIKVKVSEKKARWSGKMRQEERGVNEHIYLAEFSRAVSLLF